jgi:hypothetical protein
VGRGPYPVGQRTTAPPLRREREQEPCPFGQRTAPPRDINKYERPKGISTSVIWPILGVRWRILRKRRPGGGPYYSRSESIRPRSTALTASWARSETPSFEMMRYWWRLTVERLRCSSLAIWRLVLPARSDRSTSSSLGVSNPGGGFSRLPAEGASDGYAGWRASSVRCLTIRSSAIRLTSRMTSSWSTGESPSRVPRTTPTNSCGPMPVST